MFDTIALMKVAEELSRQTGIRAYPASIDRILGAVQKSANFWSIVVLSGEPVPLVAVASKILISAGLLKITSDGIFLTTEGYAYCKFANIFPPVDNGCRECASSGISLERYGDALAAFKEIVAARPSALAAYDQGFITAESTLRRIAVMDRLADLKGKDLLALGDDDLVGIAAGLTALPARVVVLEIDPRLVEFIRETARRYRLPVEVDTHDLRQPLPKHLVGVFDVVETDPPESASGYRLFIRRALAGLKGPRHAAYFGLTRAESSLDKWALLQRFFLDQRTVITDIIPDFNRYELWDYHADTRAARLAPLPQAPDAPWYRSALIRVETIDGFSPLEVENIAADDSIYHDNESSTT
ncbi:MAG: bis-aminopropyl spermidine synthase family protein [bacterium]